MTTELHATVEVGGTPDPLTDRVRATWTAGDFGRIAKGYSLGAAEFIARLELEPDERVLDVACGTGNLALPAARIGASVTGIDIAPNLISQARVRAAAERLAITFDVGNAERLPYANGTFDSVVTMFGAMFAARPERAATGVGSSHSDGRTNCHGQLDAHRLHRRDVEDDGQLRAAAGRHSVAAPLGH
jgi:SAM-dependent methyltransferase